MRHYPFLPAATTLLFACACLVPLRADPVVYSDLSTWLSVTDVTVGPITFSNFSGSTFVGSPYSTQGVTITAPNNYLFAGSGASLGYDDGYGEYLYSVYPLTVAFPTGDSSFAMDLGNYGSSGNLSVGVSTSDGSFDYSVYAPVQGSGFFGFSLGSGETLNSVTISGAQTANVIDNIEAGNVVAPAGVPDTGSSVLLLALALLPLCFVNSRKARLV